VLVFACNWCSYAGADTAGVARLEQSPQFRLLRVMCSGRVHPSHVLRAFALGADGVMVSGCHFGDCHYMFGNYRAEEQFKKTTALVDLLGLGEGRLRLEWISAAEGARFAQTMNEFTETVRGAGRSPAAPQESGAPGEQAASAMEPLTAEMLLGGSRAFTCLECGRCTAACPVARYQRFSPRRLVSRAFSEDHGSFLSDPSLWTCLTCKGCERVCPMQVNYDGFILTARAASVGRTAAAREGGGWDGTPDELEKPPAAPAREAMGRSAAQPTAIPCSHGGVFEQISKISARPNLRQNRLGWLTSDLKAQVLQEGERGDAADLLYIGCSPYFSAYFGGETGEGLTQTMRSAVQLLNRAGITPALLANERCCGYHLRLAGHTAEADRLERLVCEQIQASGASRVITFCPECLVALREAASRHRMGWDVMHLSRVLQPKLEDLAAAGQPKEGAMEESAPTATFQDPCRLGRYSGIYDAPRKLVVGLAGIEVVEMAHNRERAICCGNTAWLNCNAGTKRLQTARLDEAVATGSRRLVTACPGCFIHLRCAQEGMEGPPAEIEIVDIWNLLAGPRGGDPPAEPQAAKRPPKAKAGSRRGARKKGKGAAAPAAAGAERGSE
jgi:Fe-S oxidoreductase/coenzyme F420-reducing hydrogenase delta subunit